MPCRMAIRLSERCQKEVRTGTLMPDARKRDSNEEKRIPRPRGALGWGGGGGAVGSRGGGGAKNNKGGGTEENAT